MASPARRYRLSQRALADLDSIYGYTLRRWSQRQADSYHGELIAGIEALADGGLVGRSFDERYFSLRVGSHLVFYRADQTTLYVVRVLHSAMDFHRHLGD